MEAMDLSTAPPRKPRAELGGIIFLPRSIDKARAHLPGGNPGPYVMRGFTQQMLDMLGIPLESFQAEVMAASSEDDVLTYVLGHTAPEKIAAWNEHVCARKPRNGDRVSALEIYPWLGERPDLIFGLDVLEEDDHRHFAGRA